MDPMTLAEAFPVRKTKTQKKQFREAVICFANEQGYAVREEKGSYGSVNLVIGQPETAEYLITAHYDTCATMIIPNFITPCNFLPYAVYQLIVTVGVFLLASIPAWVVWRLTEMPMFSVYVWYGIVLVAAFLLVAGPANSNNANDNTSGVIGVLELARSFPEQFRDKVCFVLFDLEEAGLVGSAAYQKAHKRETKHQLVVNLDCIGDGDIIMMFPGKRVRKHEKYMCTLGKTEGQIGRKSLLVRQKGFSFYPSDQYNFPYGVAVCALQKGRFGLQIARIHTRRDTIMDITNINILRAAITSMICCAD